MNSRDHKLYLVRESIFFTIPREFEEIKETYKRMIQLFILKIDSKPTPSNKEIYSKYVYPIGSLIRDMSKELDGFIGLEQSHNDRKWHQNADILFKKLESYTSKCLAIYKKLKSDDIVDFNLFQSIAIDTFYFINDCYFHRSLFVWGTKIANKDGINRLNNILHTAISEMHIQLMEFLNRVKTANGNSIVGQWYFNQKSVLHPMTMERDFECYTMKYGSEPEIKKILEILIMASAELKSYGYPSFSREQCESMLEIDEKILGLPREVFRIKKSLVRKKDAQVLLNEMVSLRNTCKSIIEII
jgi:hypothetical protein